MARDGRWVEVPLEIAKQHPLYGIGGWLTLVILGSVVSPIRIVAQLGPVYSGVDYAALPPTLSAFIIVEIAINALIVLWSIANLFLLFNKHPLFPRNLAGLMGVSAVFIVLDAFVTKAVMDSIGQPMGWSQVFDAETSREVGRSIFGALIWIPYAFVSKRVNVTYLNRVRADDPLLKESVATVF